MGNVERERRGLMQQRPRFWGDIYLYEMGMSDSGGVGEATPSPL